MRGIIFYIGICILSLTIYGCAIPSGMKYYKEGHSTATTNADIEECKVSTALWWPFDDLSKCMQRRGYKLIGENELQDDLHDNNIMRNEKQSEIYEKLIELKKLKDNDIISEEDYERKKTEILSDY